MSGAESPVKLRTLLGDHAVAAALKKGEVSSPLIQFEFVHEPEVRRAFKAMLNERQYDCGELAICTYLQAKAYGKPYVLLPIVLSSRFQHHCIVYDSRHGSMAPRDIVGKRVGVRSFQQTTGVWVRGILQHEYGVDIDHVQWITFEGGHVEEHRDPANCTPAPHGKKLLDMLFTGELDAALLGNEMPADGRLRTLIPNPEADAMDWYRRQGIVPVSHMFVVQDELSRSRPDIVREIYRLFVESKKKARFPNGPDLKPLGISANRKNLETIIEYTYEQKLIPRRFDVDELFDDVTVTLGV